MTGEKELQQLTQYYPPCCAQKERLAHPCHPAAGHEEEVSSEVRETELIPPSRGTEARPRRPLSRAITALLTLLAVFPPLHLGSIWVLNACCLRFHPTARVKSGPVAEPVSLKAANRALGKVFVYQLSCHWLSLSPALSRFLFTPAAQFKQPVYKYSCQHTAQGVQGGKGGEIEREKE